MATEGAIARVVGIAIGFSRTQPSALYGLLFTIVLRFAIQGDAITSKPFVLRIPLRRTKGACCSSSKARSTAQH